MRASRTSGHRTSVRADSKRRERALALDGAQLSRMALLGEGRFAALLFVGIGGGRRWLNLMGIELEKDGGGLQTRGHHCKTWSDARGQDLNGALQIQVLGGGKGQRACMWKALQEGQVLMYKGILLRVEKVALLQRGQVALQAKGDLVLAKDANEAALDAHINLGAERAREVFRGDGLGKKVLGAWGVAVGIPEGIQAVIEVAGGPKHASDHGMLGIVALSGVEGLEEQEVLADGLGLKEQAQADERAPGVRGLDQNVEQVPVNDIEAHVLVRGLKLGPGNPQRDGGLGIDGEGVDDLEHIRWVLTLPGARERAEGFIVEGQARLGHVSAERVIQTLKVVKGRGVLGLKALHVLTNRWRGLVCGVKVGLEAHVKGVERQKERLVHIVLRLCVGIGHSGDEGMEAGHVFA